MEWINDDIILNYISIINMISTLFIAILALFFTVKSYKLKSGKHIRGSYSIVDSIACEDLYVGTIELENYKDKAVIIYNIYLKIGYNCYIEIENFEDNPLILNPFEIYKKIYDPIEMYSVNCRRVSVKGLNDKKIKKNLVLSTSSGKYVIKKHIKHWNPTYMYFKNYMTSNVIPMRLSYEGKYNSYGENTKYIIDIKNSNGNKIIPINKDSYKFKIFEEFYLSIENIQSKENLNNFLEEMKECGKFKCKQFEVIDLESYRQEHYKEYNSQRKVVIEPLNWFTYNIIGKVVTIYDNYKLYRENKRLKNQRK